MKKKEIEELTLRPLIYTGKAFYALIIVLIGTIAWFGYAWWTQLTYGLGVTGMNRPVYWGLYIANFIFLGGIGHTGIAISAVIRLRKLEAYRPITRIAESLTVVSTIIALINIVFDLGRPDRMLNMFIYYAERVAQSPFIWDLTAVSIFLALSLIYLYLEMREDIAICAEKVPKRRRLYRILSKWYTPGERERIDRVLWWLAIIILPVLVIAESIVAYFMGLMVSQAGWYNPFFAPYFVTAAIASGIATVIVIAWLVRRLFNWDEYIKPEIFKGLGTALSILVLIYLYFMVSEQITIRYAGPVAERIVSEALLLGEFAWLYWSVVVLGLIVPFLILLVPKTRTIGGTVIASILIVAGLWIKRLLIVVPPLTRPRLPYPWGVYTPTWEEWSLILGSYAIGILIYAIFAKLFPIVETRLKSFTVPKQ